MKLGSLKAGGRDGTLVVVSRDLQKAVKVPEIATTMQFALDNWDSVAPKLNEVSEAINSGEVKGSFAVDFNDFHSPLPRAYQWADGSAYLNHVELVRKARGAEMPKEFESDPLMYQGGSDSFIPPRADVPLGSESWGIDFEAEVAAITGDVKQGESPESTAKKINLLMLVNDVSLRLLIPKELGKGFGFFQSKPASSFSPVAVTPDELGDKWKDGTIHLPLRSELNGKLFGQPNAGVDMNFSLPELVSHAAKTRDLCAGTIVGTGTVSNRDRSVGSSCIMEVRMIEKIETGDFKTPFMSFGDRIKIEMLDESGNSVFGAIDQKIVKAE